MREKLDLGRIVLIGEEVTLRPLDLGDAEALSAATAESREYYGFNPVPEGLDGARAYLAWAFSQRDDGLRYPFTIVWGGRVVGSTSYWDFQPWQWPAGCPQQQHDRPDAVEIGYTWLAASAQRTRCNTEAKYLLLRHAFETWEVYRVRLRTDARNERSRRAIERLGAKLDGLLRGDVPGRDCTVRTSASYSILAEEWPEVAARLKSYLARSDEVMHGPLTSRGSSRASD
jgi:RimJ/RimL family protein N-acetyltransferase